MSTWSPCCLDFHRDILGISSPALPEPKSSQDIPRQEGDAPNHPSNPRNPQELPPLGFPATLGIPGSFTKRSDKEEKQRINFHTIKSVKNLAFSHCQQPRARKLLQTRGQERDLEVFWGRKRCHKHVSSQLGDIPCPVLFVCQAGASPWRIQPRDFSRVCFSPFKFGVEDSGWEAIRAVGTMMGQERAFQECLDITHSQFLLDQGSIQGSSAFLPTKPRGIWGVFWGVRCG